MKLKRIVDNVTEEIIFPIKRWGKFSNPTLAFMLSKGFVEVIPDPSTPPTDEDAWDAKVLAFTLGVQSHLDTTAQSWGYDSIISLCTYDGNSDPKYSAEGAVGKEWRSSVWRYCEDELAKIATGTRQEPESNEAFIAELPTITRPKL